MPFKGKGKKKQSPLQEESSLNFRSSDDSDFFNEGTNSESYFNSENDQDFEEPRIPPSNALKRKRSQNINPKGKAASSAPNGSSKKCSNSDSQNSSESEKPIWGSAALPPGVDRYSCERARSGRAQCKKCNELILKGELRIGAVMGEGRWGPMTAWHHLGCIAPKCKRPEDIEGYDELSDDCRDTLLQRLNGCQEETDELYQPINPDDLVRKSWDTKAVQPDKLRATLLPYQLEGLGWLLHQEYSDARGGILADEMGMGKTIQAISLMLSNRPEKRNTDQMNSWKKAEQEVEFPWKNQEPLRGGTLVICPVIALLQWRAEIERFVEEGSLNVEVYHGSSRKKDLDRLAKADVVLTTYAVVQADYSRMTAKGKVKCPECGRILQVQKIAFHRKFFCGASAQRSSAQSKTVRKTRKSDDAVDFPSKKGDSFSEIETKKETIPSKKSKTAAKRHQKTKSDIHAKRIDPVSKYEHFETVKGPVKRVIPPRQAKNFKSLQEASSIEEDNDSDSSFSLEKHQEEELNSAILSESDLSTEPENDEIELSAKKFMASSKKLKLNMTNSNRNEGKKNRKKWDMTVVSEQNDSEDSLYFEIDKKSKKDKKLNNALPLKSKLNETSIVNENDVLEFEADLKVTTKGKKPVQNSKSRCKAKKSNFDLNEDQTELPLLEKESMGKFKKGKGKALSRPVEMITENLESNSKDVTHNRDILSPLHCISWFRVILDEAHVIKDRSTSTAKAVYGLCGMYKLCLTGTPLQNRVDELYSPIRFLRMDPFAYYFCKSKNCTCKSLHYRFDPFSRKCDDCGHTPMQHSCAFNKFVLNPISRAGNIGEGRRAFMTLKTDILDKILLRRTKATRSEDIALPPRIIRVRRYRLSDREEDFYQALYTQSQAQFDDYVNMGVILNNYAHIFDILIRLRQALDHPYLVVHSNSQISDVGARNTTQVSSIEKDDMNECGVCKEIPERPVVAQCGHIFCRTCIEDLLSAAVEGVAMECPECAAPLTIDLTEDGKKAKGQAVGRLHLSNVQKKSIINKIDLNRFQTSTKLEALMQELYEMQQRDPSAKAIVFSQFVNMLDLLEFRIKRGGIQCVKLSGHMSINARDVVLESFKEDPEVKVLLISLKAGGVALNLTVASYCFIMDPWWNPAAEMQAIDRTHRMGQYKPIHAVRFIIEGTIEERILKLQDKKRLVFDSTIGGDASSLARLTVDDLRFLFSPGGCGRS